ncbi:MAG TPA: cytochrome c [Ohtaekwangia sp.]|uniref:c-type cytochrome n=1 Tax=Ohtaekwangia sp. TaxID=2066019 RepID=UPI002F957F63
MQNISTVKEQQYYVHGEQLYLKNCSNCHQAKGTGLGLLYPPLAKSDFVDNNFESVICLMRNGIKGELVVNGKNFNKEMPGIPSLTDLEIAEIATYLYNNWGHQRDSIDVKEVSAILHRCQ